MVCVPLLTMPQRNCLLCYHICEDSNSKESIDESRIPGNSVLFILKMLETPPSFCEGLVNQHGDPSNWISCCQICWDLISEADEVFQKIAELEKELEGVKGRIRQVLDISRDAQSSNIPNLSTPTDEIRKFAFAVANILPVAHHFDMTKSEPESIVNGQQEEETYFPHMHPDDDYSDASALADNIGSSREIDLEYEKFSGSTPLRKAAQQAHCKITGSAEQKDARHVKKIRPNQSIRRNTRAEVYHEVRGEGKMSQMSANPLSRKENDYKKRFPFKCERCVRRFPVWSKLKSHWRVTHPELEWKIRPLRMACELCEKKVRIRYLKTHQKFCRGAKKVTVCEICGLDFQVPYRLKLHLISHKRKEGGAAESPEKSSGKSEKSSCSESLEEKGAGEGKKSSGSGNPLLRGENVQKINCPFKCEWCEGKFAGWNKLKSHYRKLHPELELKTCPDKVTCEFCEKRVRVGYLKIHNRICLREKKSTVCDICRKVCKKQYDLKVHREGVHFAQLGLEPIECKECQTIFKSRNALRNHLFRFVKCKKSLSVVCSVCNAGFFSKGNLNAHMIKEHGARAKTFSSLYRPKSFSTSSNDICGKGEIKPKNLKKHVQHHETKVTMACQHCDKLFSKIHALKLHLIRRHRNTGEEKSFGCQICCQEFLSNRLLRRHSQKHTGFGLENKRGICAKKFTGKTPLDRHMKMHKKQKLFSPSPE